MIIYCLSETVVSEQNPLVLSIVAQFLLFPHVEGEVLEGNLLSGVDCVIQGFHDVIDFLVVCLDAVLNIHVSHELFCVVETRVTRGTVLCVRCIF